MRIRIIQKPSAASIDGLDLSKFAVGDRYEVGSTFGALFLAEGWAEPIEDVEPALVIPLRELAPDAPAPTPSNLSREFWRPYSDTPPATPAQRRRRPRRPPS